MKLFVPFVFSIFFFACLLALTHAAQVGEPITSITTVRNLQADDAAKKLPVDIVAQALVKSHAAVFIHDGNEGIYLACHKMPHLLETLKSGDIIRITGTTHPGNFIPHIEAASFEVVGNRPRPKPRKLSVSDFDAPPLDCQWVDISGIVIGIRYQIDPSGEQPLYMKLKCLTREVEFRLPPDEDQAEMTRKLMHRQIRMRGVAVTQANENRQFSQRFFAVNSSADLLDTTPEKALPLGISGLARSDAPPAQFVRTTGTVLHSSAEDIVIRGDGGCLRAKVADGLRIARGTLVTLEGQVVAGGFSPLMYVTRVLPDTGGTPPVPLKLSPEENYFSTDMDQELVTLGARLLSVIKGIETTILQCEAGSRQFEAHLPAPAVLPREAAAGSQLQLTGICQLISTEPVLHVYSQPSAFSLLLRDPADITVNSSPGWWTLQRTFLSLGLVAATAALTLGWAITLRTRIRKQTALITNQVAEKTTLEERQRIARELHDTLQQHMTGLALQLEHVGKRVAGDPEIEPPLGLARRMLDHCRDEARDSIIALRETAHSTHEPFNKPLDDILLEEAHLGNVSLDVKTAGTPYPIDPLDAGHLRRIAQEGVRNALRHSGAKSISLTFDYLEEKLLLTVEDTGSGFDQASSSIRGHFGLVGIRERCLRIGATLDIHSIPGKGTRLTATLPQQNAASLPL